jgi:hypothetical protein
MLQKNPLKTNASFEVVLKIEQAITKKCKDIIALAFSSGG